MIEKEVPNKKKIKSNLITLANYLIFFMVLNWSQYEHYLNNLLYDIVGLIYFEKEEQVQKSMISCHEFNVNCLFLISTLKPQQKIKRIQN